MSGRHEGMAQAEDVFIHDQYVAWLEEIDEFIGTILPAERNGSMTVEQQYAEVIRRLDETTRLLCTGRLLAQAVLTRG